jgi:hypothetical protein
MRLVLAKEIMCREWQCPDDHEARVAYGLIVLWPNQGLNGR